jgi:hypothetical protein
MPFPLQDAVWKMAMSSCLEWEWQRPKNGKVVMTIVTMTMVKAGAGHFLLSLFSVLPLRTPSNIGS